MVADRAIDPLFDAAIESTEEAIVNALVAAETMVGRDGVTGICASPRPSARGDGQVRATRPARMTTLRSATATDLPAMAAILAADDEAIEWPDRPGWPYLEHLLARARTLVAEIDDVVIGFGASMAIGADGTRFLTDLFVDPSRQDHGAGRALLDAVLDGSERRMTFSSADPRAIASYIRVGMRPWWPLLYVAGEATVMADPSTTGPSWRPADLDETVERSRAWTGIDRRTDFVYYASLPEAAGFAVIDAGEVAAVGWSRRDRWTPGRWLDHVSIAPDADPIRAAAGAWRAAGPSGGGTVHACIPGPHPVLTLLLGRGVRIVDRDQWCSSDPDLVDPVRLLPNPSFL